MYRLLRRLALILPFALGQPGLAQDLSALARLDAGRSSLRATSQAVDLSLAISQPVPWRVRFLDSPPRLVLDAREIDWTGVAALGPDAPVMAVRAGTFRPGWSRLVVELDGPWVLVSSEMVTADDGAMIDLHLRHGMPPNPLYVKGNGAGRVGGGAGRRRHRRERIVRRRHVRRGRARVGVRRRRRGEGGARRDRGR